MASTFTVAGLPGGERVAVNTTFTVVSGTVVRAVSESGPTAPS